MWASGIFFLDMGVDNKKMCYFVKIHQDGPLWFVYFCVYKTLTLKTFHHGQSSCHSQVIKEFEKTCRILWIK